MLTVARRAASTDAAEVEEELADEDSERAGVLPLYPIEAEHRLDANSGSSSTVVASPAPVAEVEEGGAGVPCGCRRSRRRNVAVLEGSFSTSTKATSSGGRGARDALATTVVACDGGLHEKEGDDDDDDAVTLLSGFRNSVPITSFPSTVSKEVKWSRCASR